MFKKSLAYLVGRAAAKMHYARWLDVYAVCSVYEPELYYESQRKARIPTKVRWNVWRRDNFTCHYCHMYGHELTLDHVVPETRGGKSTEENLVTACSSCNQRKGKTGYKEFVDGKWLKKKRKSSPYPRLWTTQGPVTTKKLQDGQVTTSRIIGGKLS